MRRFGIAGSSGSGKTTLLEALVPWLARQRLLLACIKHTHHPLPSLGQPGLLHDHGAAAVIVAESMDSPGKDSWRLRRAGCPCVILTGRSRLNGDGDTRGTDRMLQAAFALVPAATDLVLIEGFKTVDLPKIEVFRPALGKPPLWPTCPGILALASDAVPAIESAPPLPVLDLADLDAIGQLVLRHAQHWPPQHCSRSDG
ncbi:molybdopterin-guanine dinucleotide biosynthesis protein B [Paracidovorax citrulli]